MADIRTRPGRVAGASLAVLSLIPALISGFLFTVSLPDDVRRYEDYTAAEPCGDSGSTDDCLRTLPLTVDRTVVKKGKSGSCEATVSDPAASWKTVVRFGDSGPLLARLEPGDQVTATVWRGAVMVLARGDLRQSTADEPRDDPQMTAGLATFAGLLAALGLGFATALLAGLGGREPWTWRSLGLPLLIGMAVTTLAVAVPAFAIGLPWWVVPGLAVPFVTYAAFRLHRYRLERLATHPAE
ncbi:hypothetical protein [Streptomyces sp. NRRL S-244]|uniref:hypothetical protein n=1 Tax=Streptomyces sp. NRRL S-244 TaxID=1463897 RepID=UPI00131A5412|nr:hypothetical protein [Streptomyces sp. NRRL S-244]